MLWPCMTFNWPKFDRANFNLPLASASALRLIVTLLLALTLSAAFSAPSLASAAGEASENRAKKPRLAQSPKPSPENSTGQSSSSVLQQNPSEATLVAPVEPLLYPHLTVSAAVVRHGKFTYYTYPGAGVRESSFLMGTLAVGLFDHFELGTIPIYYFIPFHEFNSTLKFKLFQTDEVAVALGHTYMQFNLSTMSDGQSLKMPSRLWVNYVSLITNYHPRGSLWAFGWVGNISVFKSTEDGTPNATGMLKIGPMWDTEADISRRLNRHFTLTSGLSYVGLGLIENARYGSAFGLGATTTWHRPRKFLSNPAVGVHYYPSLAQTKTLFTTTFY